MKKMLFAAALVGIVLGGASMAWANVANVLVALNTTTVNTASRYTITFTTGAAGALTAGVGTISVAFPANTNVPAVISPGAQITVNGTNIADAAIGSSSTLVITTPVGIANSELVTLVINTGTASIINPSVPDAYTLTAATSAEATPVTSGSYSTTASTAALVAGSVTVTPNTIGNPADYTFLFDTGAAGALWGAHSQIVVVFPGTTSVPASSLAGVLVSGVAATSAMGSGGNTVTIVPSQNIANNTGVTVVIPVSAGVRNPTTTGTTYHLVISTSAQTTTGNSSNYSISTFATAVTGIAATVSPDVIGNYAQYSVAFTTDATRGALVGGVSNIYITFPSGTAVAAGALTGITVNGIAATSATGNSSSRLITVVPSQNLAGGSTITVVVPLAGNAVRNPTAVSTAYTLLVRTSPQPTNGTSANYTITISATPVTVTGVTPSPNIIGNRAQYTVVFTTSATEGNLIAGTSQIVITFPSGTTVYNGAISGVTVNGSAATSAAGNSSARTVTIVPSTSLAGGSTVSVVIPLATNGVRNPLTASTYALQVHTSPQSIDATSGNYTITTLGTTVNITSVDPVPMLTDVFAQYTVIFDIATTGDLVGGSSQIVLTFPGGTTVTAGSISGVTVNGTNAASTSGNSTSRTLTIVPAQNIDGGNAVMVVVPSSGVVRNPYLTGSYTLQAHTSPQPANDTSPSYSIAVPTPTPTVTPTPTYTVTPTITLTSTISPTITLTNTPLPTATLTSTMTITPYQIAATEVVTYPSPVSGNVVWFYFQTQGPAKLKIDIYNIMGERVGLVEEDVVEAGYNRASWSVKTTAPGIYLYHMKLEYANGEVQNFAVKKIIVVKK